MSAPIVADAVWYPPATVERRIVGVLERGVRPHYVYFIQAACPDGLLPPMVKIGTTALPDRRLEQISKQLAKAPDWLGDIGTPEDLRYWGLLPGDSELEKELHRAFASHRIAGEWFWLEPLETFIEVLLDGFCVCHLCRALSDRATS